MCYKYTSNTSRHTFNKVLLKQLWELLSIPAAKMLPAAVDFGRSSLVRKLRFNAFHKCSIGLDWDTE